MKLTKKDKQFLISIGCTEKDFPKIEQAESKTIFEHYPKVGAGWKITAKKALDILGREQFLFGLYRSSFHWSAVRCAADGSEVYFDSSRLFR